MHSHHGFIDESLAYNSLINDFSCASTFVSNGINTKLRNSDLFICYPIYDTYPIVIDMVILEDHHNLSASNYSNKDIQYGG